MEPDEDLYIPETKRPPPLWLRFVSNSYAP